MSLLDGTNFNVRLFGLPSPDTGTPPPDLRVKTYVSEPRFATVSASRTPISTVGRVQVLSCQTRAHIAGDPLRPEAWLAEILQTWKPHIVHTFGIYPAGLFFYVARHSFNVASIGRWVLQTRGGSDLQLRRLDPVLAKEIRDVASDPASIITDSLTNARVLEEIGVDPALVADISPVPGTGGIDVDELAAGSTPPSQRRLIIWPKAYEVQWSKALPVLEALRLVWHRLPPCRIVMFGTVQTEVRQWLLTLPKEVQDACSVHNFVPRAEVLATMRQARLMLAPSLVDGRPNTMLEAMAAGAIPIVSPIESIREIVAHKENVLFARNLYIDEIANALLTGMLDDVLVDVIARNNLALVRDVAHRGRIRSKVVAFYRSLATDPHP
jgi:hypothetical protein